MLVHKSLAAAKKLERDGVEVEIIDLRSICPLDMDTVAESVKKTGKVLIAHEDKHFMGFGAEVSAQISETLFEYLDAPVMRIGSEQAMVPHSPILEERILPQTDDVERILRQLIAF